LVWIIFWILQVLSQHYELLVNVSSSAFVAKLW
jgi:hypothetical protein